MDQFWRVLRIGCISVFAVIALGVGSCILLVRLNEWPKEKARAALWSRSMEILKQKRSHQPTVKLGELFGNDIDGICVVLDGPAFEDKMREASPPQFAPAIPAVVRAAAGHRKSGLDSDTHYWFVYAVKDAHVLRNYELVFKSSLDIDVTEDGDRCYGAATPIELNFDPRDPDFKESLRIEIPPREIKS